MFHYSISHTAHSDPLFTAMYCLNMHQNYLIIYCTNIYSLAYETQPVGIEKPPQYEHDTTIGKTYGGY